MANIKTINCWSICLRISIFILNGFVWVGALFALICGLMVGFSNGTFSLDAMEDDEYEGGEIRWKDALYTTPATLLVYYGVIMLLTAIFGCFSAAGGKKCCGITFIIFIILTILFDIIFGYLVYWNPFAMRNFIDDMDKSMDNYGLSNGARFGVYPHHPTIYWDHLQRTGSCCGKFESEEWRNKTIGTDRHDFSLPDSCCTSDYDYRKCGWRIWKHMEGDMDHYRSGMLKKVGCVTIFPEEITTKYHEIAYIAISLGIFMVICGICAIVLLCLMFMKKYKTGQGPQQNPRFALALRTTQPPPAIPINYSINEEMDSRYQDINFSNQRVSITSNDTLDGRFHRHSSAHRRVHPIDGVQKSKVRKHSKEAKPRSSPQDRRHTPKSTTDIYKNDEYGGVNSDIEELPVIYREEAEARARRKNPTRERAQSQ